VGRGVALGVQLCQLDEEEDEDEDEDPELELEEPFWPRWRYALAGLMDIIVAAMASSNAQIAFIFAVSFEYMSTPRWGPRKHAIRTARMQTCGVQRHTERGSVTSKQLIRENGRELPMASAISSSANRAAVVLGCRTSQ
jgi:hypothetical protein